MNPRYSSHLVFAVALLLGANAHAAGWSAGTTVSPTGSPDPTRGAQTNSIAVNAAGLTVAAWDQFFYTNGGGSTVGVNVETNGRWGTPQTISTPGKFSNRARAAAGGDGTLIVAWSSETATDRTVEVSIREAGQTQWSAPTVLATGSLAGSPAPGSVQLVMNQNGEAWAAWSIYDGAHNAVQVAHRPAGAGGVFGAPQPVSAPGVDAVQPALAINARGDVGAAWAGSPYAMFTSPNVITYRYRVVGGDFGAPVQISPMMNPYTGYQNSPLLCLDKDGLATAAWMGAGLQAAREATANNWELPQLVSPLIALASYITPGLACDEQGSATVAVTIFDATIGVQRAQLWANTRAAAGSWSGPVKLTGNNPRKTEDIAASSVAMTPGGSMAYVAYIDHYNGLVGALHRTANGWGNPYTVGKTSNVSSFAETVTAAANGTSAARIIWKTKGGMQHLVSDWRP